MKAPETDPEMMLFLLMLCDHPNASIDELAHLFDAAYEGMDVERANELLCRAARSGLVSFDEVQPCGVCGLREIFCDRCGRRAPEAEFHISRTVSLPFACRWCGHDWFVPDAMLVGSACLTWTAVVMDLDPVPQAPGNTVIRVAVRSESRGMCRIERL